MTKTIDLALVGATTPVGEAIIALLEARKVAIGKLFPLAEQNTTGHKVGFRGKYLTVRDVAGFDFSQVQAALFAVMPETAEEFVPKAAAAGCVCVDLSGRFERDDDVPLVMPEVNPAAIADYSQRNIIASPSSAAVLLWTALKPIYDAVGIERINVVTLQAVSDGGKPAIDELAAQTVALLNMREAHNEIYPKRIAFNALPQIGAYEANGYTQGEMKLLWESQKLLADSTIVVNATAVCVPVFHGHSLAVHLETAAKIDVRQARVILEAAPGVTVVDSPEPGGYPTAVSEAAGSDEVFVGRIREDISHPNGLDLWVVADNIRRGAALNGVRIVEILVKEYM
jgi:aspartate-semialdehyde dehydrogenase